MLLLVPGCSIHQSGSICAHPDALVLVHGRVCLCKKPLVGDFITRRADGLHVVVALVPLGCTFHEHYEHCGRCVSTSFTWCLSWMHRVRRLCQGLQLLHVWCVFVHFAPAMIITFGRAGRALQVSLRMHLIGCRHMPDSATLFPENTSPSFRLDFLAIDDVKGIRKRTKERKPRGIKTFRLQASTVRQKKSFHQKVDFPVSC